MNAVTAAVLLGLLGLIVGLRRRARLAAQRDQATLQQAEEEGAHLPPSLHPVIDTQTCIGSLSCVSACPEGQILGIVEGAATLIRGAACIGHGRCALECPVDAIKLVFGSSTRGVDLPEVDTHFESSRPGVFIVGELGGMGLIKNAMIQGLQAASHLGAALASTAQSETLDVVIVGAGPAGLGCAAALKQAGLRFSVLERDALGGAVTVFPRHKVVMTETVELPGWGNFGKRLMSKEELVEGLQSVVRDLELPIREGVRVDAIRGEDGAFEVETSKGMVRAKKVVLAIGRRGTPRRLGVPGEDSAKVTYALLDPEQYEGKRMIVVGGGDSAVESALALADFADDVSLVYRKPSFNRCRAANRLALDAAVAQGRVRLMTQAQVAGIEPDAVSIRTAGGTTRMGNDFVIVCAGGELPVGFLSRIGIGMERHLGTKAMASPAARPKKVAGQYTRSTAEQEAAKNRRQAWGLSVLGAGVIATLGYLGAEYYLLSEEARLDSPMHVLWRPAGDVGHGIGVVASIVMLSNFLYPLRKRLGFLKGTAPINRWLNFHVFVGLLSPAVIAFHAAFQSNNLIATGTFASLLIVVVTGLVGRFVYGLIPRAQGRLLTREALEAQVRDLLDTIGTRILKTRAPGALQRSLQTIRPRFDRSSSVLGLFVRYPTAWLLQRVEVWRRRDLFSTHEAHRSYAHGAHQLLRLKFQLELYESLRRFLGWWRVLHVALALFLVVIMGAHIGVALYLGYGWILF